MSRRGTGRAGPSAGRDPEARVPEQGREPSVDAAEGEQSVPYRWSLVTPQAAFAPRDGAGAVGHRGKMWLLGGWNPRDKAHFPRIRNNEVWSSADGVHWECHLPSAPWPPRQYHEVAIFDERMWVLEGYHDGNRHDVWYSADGLNRCEWPGTPWAARHAASVFVHDGAPWVAAGNNMQSDVWKLERVAGERPVTGSRSLISSPSREEEWGVGFAVRSSGSMALRQPPNLLPSRP